MKNSLNVDDYFLLWNQAFVKISDVRRACLKGGESLSAYRLPSSAFLYIVRGNARIDMDGETFSADRHHVLHGGKGTRLEMFAEDPLEYYLILYRAGLMLPARREWMQLMEDVNPFRAQFRFAPRHPIALCEAAERMHRSWERFDSGSKLRAKSLFYQFLYELLAQMAAQGLRIDNPDPAAQAMSYIHEHYKEPIALDGLADRLGCSARQLLRRFKARTGTSPIEYLIRVRVEKAKELLRTTDFALKDIAESVGYADSYYFSRVFKKAEGISPIRFKEQAGTAVSRLHPPSRKAGSSIVEGKLRRYIVNENHYQRSGEGVLSMQTRARATAVMTLLICFTLLLSACGSGSGNNNPGTGGTPSAGSVSSAPSASPQAPETETARTVKHAMGEEKLVGTPERVVILTNEGTEALLAVGIKPVGAVQSWTGDPWYDHIKDEMEGVTAVGDELQPNIELIASLKPDLIIGNKVRQEKIYEQLKQIAPTVFAEDLAGNWKINFKLYSEAVNKVEEGERAMADFDQRVEDAKIKLGDKAATKVSLVRFTASQVRIYQKQTFAGVLLDQLGIARPEAQDKDAFIEVLTKESIPAMDGDVMFYFVSENAGSTDGAKVAEEWMNDPLFRNLNVAKTGKVVKVDEAIWNTAGGYEAANLLLDELLEYFEAE
ncbi:ABC transporter substrate-binding protein [Paenibacillaceae bacterium WGS1546]|uniref:ABC transporter substrate-binding protein n=1 Tax=Cohnella sp. WGS1546 TaxID=3366810 RepID=UPI00372D0B7B